MARISLWGRVKNKVRKWFSGDDNRKATPPKPRAIDMNRDARNQTVSSSINKRAFLASLNDSQKEKKEEDRVQNAYKATKQEYKSVGEELKNSFKKLDGALKKDVPDPKQAAAQKSKERAKKTAKKAGDALYFMATDEERKAIDAVKDWNKANKQQYKEFHERTGNKYNAHTGDKAHDKQAAQLIKGGFDSADPVAEELAIKYHPIALSATRGALSGTTFGLSELAIQSQAKRDKERARNEQYYQENKNRGAELAGEIGASLFSFGGVGKAFEAPTARIVGSELGEKAVGKLAASRLTKATAKRAVKKAGGEVTEDIIKTVARRKAENVATGLTSGALIDATAGNLMNATMASREHEVGSKEWWKAFGKYGLLNAGISGGVSMLPVALGGRRIAAEELNKLAAQNAARRGVVDRANALDDILGAHLEANPARNAVNIRDLAMPKAEAAARNADEVVETAAKGTRLDEINRELDAVHNELAGNGRNLPEAERDALVKRFDDLMAEREALTTTRGVKNEAEIGNIGTAQAGGETVSGVDSTVSARSGADNGTVERRANASGDAGRGSGDGVFRISPEHRAKLNESGVTDTHLSDVSDDYATFSHALDEAKEASGHGGWVDPQSVKDLKKSGAKTYLSDDGKAGVAIKADGDICGVFKHPDSKHQGAVYDLIFSARANGGTKMDCYGKALVNRYEAVGYVPVARVKFNPEYVKDARLLEAQPDVFVLMKNADDLDTVASKIKRAEVNGGYHRSTNSDLDKLPVFDGENGYDEALAYRDELLARQEAELKTAPKDASEFAGATDERLDMPVENQQETRLNDARAEAEARAREIANGEEPRTKSTSQPELEPDESLPKGVRESRKRWEETRGEQLNKGDKAPTTKEVYDAYMDYHISQGTTEKVKRSKAAASQINGMSTDAEKALRTKLVESGGYDYETIFTPELYDQVNREFKDNSEYWIQRIIDGSEDLKTVNVDEAPFMQARAEYLMAVLDPQSDPAVEDAYLAAMKLAKDISSKSGQAMNIRRNFVRLTRAGRIESTIDDLYKIVDGSIGFNKAHPELMKLKGKYDRMNYIKGVLMKDPEIEKAVTKIADAKNADVVEEAYTELLIALNKNNPKSGYDIVQEWRYFNMLANPKTHIRNIFGSGFFAPIRQTSNMFRSAIESHYIDNGWDIVRHGGLSPEAALEAWTSNPKTEGGKMALEAFERRKSDILGSSKFGMQTQKGRATTAGGKLMDAASDFNSKLLTGEDDFFRTRAFRENFIKSYNAYTKRNIPITEKLLRRIEDEAIAEAEIATFNEYNAFANWLNKISRNAYDANASLGARWGGRAVNAFIPFEKVPANLMKQSINYSPLGLVKGYANIRKAVRAQDAAALNRAIDELASGLTGTGIFGLGMFLQYTTGAFTTNTGKNDPAAKHKKLQGVQNYSVTLSMLNGKKKSVTLDWLVPNSSTFFAGVEMMNQMQKGGVSLKSVGDSAADWATVSSRLIEPVMDSSMLSGLHSTLETLRGGYGDDDTKGAAEIILREGVQNWIGSLFPTAGGQIARTLYSTDKQMPSVSDKEYFKNSLKVKTGLAGDNAVTRALGIEPLAADTDAYGNVKGEKKDAGDYLKSLLGNAILPWNTKDVDLDATDEQILAEYEQRVKNGENPEDLAYLFPKKQTKLDTNIGGEMEHLSNKELSLFNQAKTTGGEEGMRFALESIMFNRYDYDSKGHKVPRSDAYTKAQKEALIEQFRDKPMREVQEWLYAQPEFQNATEAERKKVLEGLWGLNKSTKAVASQRVGGQAVYEARGKDVNEYNFKNEITESKREALQAAIDSGLLTYEEIVDFARNGGKVSYSEDEDGGGSATTYYTKSAMIDYFVEHGVPYEKAEALYNAFKSKNTKPYSGNNKYSGYGGRRRRRYGGYRHRGGSGGSKASALPKSNYKASKQTYKDIASVLKTTRKSNSTRVANAVKVEPPTVKFKKYEV